MEEIPGVLEVTSPTPITITIAGTETLIAGSTVRVEVTIEIGPLTTTITSNTTYNTEVETVVDEEQAEQQ